MNLARKSLFRKAERPAGGPGRAVAGLGPRDAGTRGRGDAGTRGRGDAGTRGHGTRGRGVWDKLLGVRCLQMAWNGLQYVHVRTVGVSERG